MRVFRLLPLLVLAVVLAAACLTDSEEGAEGEGGEASAAGQSRAAEQSGADEPADATARDQSAADDADHESDGASADTQSDASDADASDAEASTAEAEPEPEPEPPAAVTDEIVLPPGFAAFRWAEEFRQPTALAFSPDGRLFVAERAGRLWTLRDTDGNGAADQRVLFAEGFTELLGIAVASDTAVYLSERGRILLAEDLDEDGVADRFSDVVRDLPSGRHQNNGIALGPDGRLYITLGSTCNECQERSRLSATILVLDLESRALEVYASGLRNPYDLAFAPDGSLWATDNGSDPPCATRDELNRISAGVDYGWPYCETGQSLFATQRGPALDLGLHTSADGLVWFESELFPPALSGGFFIALFGSNSGDPAIGRRVQFAKLAADGSLSLQDFALGFDSPLALAVSEAASLYVADFGRGVIYRIGAPPD